MQFPPDKIPIEKWYVFKGKLPPKQDYEHYCIIIYKQDLIIRYFYITSKVEKARAILLMKDDIGALAELDPSDWDILTKDSCIQCDYDHLEECSIDNIKQGYENGTFKYIGKAHERVKTKIIHAVCASVSFTEAEKRMYTVDE